MPNTEYRTSFPTSAFRLPNSLYPLPYTLVFILTIFFYFCIQFRLLRGNAASRRVNPDHYDMIGNCGTA
ncbi:hypothetical protein D1AOALGA4SA_7401 [Olavius algarvensis Delta 1 endosymbiont]|nr:hypothetical protein D1AOALGA4SA_7401 [Olavius algarvensis Delta 1 endosymbiont]